MIVHFSKRIQQRGRLNNNATYFNQRIPFKTVSNQSLETLLHFLKHILSTTTNSDVSVCNTSVADMARTTFRLRNNTFKSFPRTHKSLCLHVKNHHFLANRLPSTITLNLPIVDDRCWKVEVDEISEIGRSKETVLHKLAVVVVVVWRIMSLNVHHRCSLAQYQSSSSTISTTPRSEQRVILL